MKFTDTAPTLPRPDGPPPWLGKLAKDATLEGAILKRSVHGRDNILTLISYVRTLYEFQEYTETGTTISSWKHIDRGSTAFPSTALSLLT